MNTVKGMDLSKPIQAVQEMTKDFPKFLTMMDDLNDINKFVYDIRIMFIIVTTCAYAGVITFLLITIYQVCTANKGSSNSREGNSFSEASSISTTRPGKQSHQTISDIKPSQNAQ